MFGKGKQRDSEVAELTRKFNDLQSKFDVLTRQQDRAKRYGPETSQAVDQLVAAAGPDMQRLLKTEVLPEVLQRLADGGDLASQLIELVDMDTLAAACSTAFIAHLTSDEVFRGEFVEALAAAIYENYDFSDMEANVAETIADRLTISITPSE